MEKGRYRNAASERCVKSNFHTGLSCVSSFETKRRILTPVLAKNQWLLWMFRSSEEGIIFCEILLKLMVVDEI